MNLIVIFSILLIHWIADFVCQTDWQATNKSKNIEALLSHTATYTFIWVILGMFPFWNMINNQPGHYTLFLVCTFICHTITDFFTSRLNSRLWQQKKVHWFFVSVGFDQFLHYVQLFLTFYLLK